MKAVRRALGIEREKNEVRKEVSKQKPHFHSETVEDRRPGTALFSMAHLRAAIGRARDLFLSIQNAKGYWVFDLEADTTIPSEYIMLQRFLGRQVDGRIREGLAEYLRRKQLPDGGWPLYEDGFADISASVKTYFALKLLGDSPNAPHMVKARQLILSLGGAARVNVFTRFTLALFGQIPWRTTPAMPN